MKTENLNSLEIDLLKLQIENLNQEIKAYRRSLFTCLICFIFVLGLEVLKY